MKNVGIHSWAIPIVGLCLLGVACREEGTSRESSGRDGQEIDRDASQVFFAPSGRTFKGSLEVTLSAELEDTKILYTIDGSEPLPTNAAEYEGPISLSSTTWLRARVLAPNDTLGTESSENYIELESSVDDFSSNLALIVIDSFSRDIDEEAEGSRPYRPLLTSFIEPDAETGRAQLDDTPDYAGYAGMHVRGQSSADYDKLQYKLEIWDEQGEDRAVSLLGMPAEADWILQAPYSDKTLMRNHLMFKWSNALGHYAPRTRFVELFINDDESAVSMDDYRGVYLLTEKIKRDPERVNVEKLSSSDTSEPEISGGYLLSHDWEEESEKYEEVPTDFTSRLYEDRINFEYPKPDKITEPQRKWIREYIDQFEESLSKTTLADGENGYAQYIDVESFADFMMLIELSKNVDGYVLSTFMHKPRGGKLAMGPIWDFNGSLGNASYFESEVPQGWHYHNEEFPADNPQAFAWREQLLSEPDFLELRESRWRSARGGVLSTAQMMADIDATAALLEEAQRRNFERWPVLGVEIWPNDEGAEARQSYAEEVEYLKEWITERASWLDDAVESR